MPVQEAIRVFQKYGIDIVEMSLDQIKKSRNTLLQRYHPDAGGPIEVAQEINAAFDLLRDETHGVLKFPCRSNLSTEPQPQPNKWAWAGNSSDRTPDCSILRSDFTDPNFIKRSMWELSGKMDEEWIIYGYDGQLFSNTIVVYGSDKIFFYMAIAMINWQTNGNIPLPCRAVFVRPRSASDLYLIYLDGKHYDQEPIKFVLDPVDANRINHSNFMQNLPKLLDQLECQAAHEH